MRRAILLRSATLSAQVLLGGALLLSCGCEPPQPPVQQGASAASTETKVAAPTEVKTEAQTEATAAAPMAAATTVAATAPQRDTAAVEPAAAAAPAAALAPTAEDTSASPALADAASASPSPAAEQTSAASPSPTAEAETATTVVTEGTKAATPFAKASSATTAPAGDDSKIDDGKTEMAAAQPSKKPLRKGKHSGIPFDPIKENGPIFVDWPAPKAALIITGREDGYLEPCGCAGLDRMKGGLSRRYTLFRTLREKGWPVVGLDVGGLVKGFGTQAERKLQTSVDAMRAMGYNAIGLGANELQMPAGEVTSLALSGKEQTSLFISANAALFGFDAGITPTYRVTEAGGRKIGVTAIVGAKYMEQIHNSEVETVDPAAALEKIVPKLAQEADFLVLLAYATKEESIELAKKFPQFKIVVTADGASEPPAQPTTVAGTSTWLVEVGEKGMCAIVVGLYDGDPPLRYQRVTLDSRFSSSPEVMQLMALYQEQLKALGLAGLNVSAVPNPQKETNGRYVGSAKCESCHDISYDIWKKTGHARAWATLVDAKPPRNFDPECISCHVVGWNPTKYFPYESGFKSIEETPHLTNVGCEDCHGPGEKHVAAELGADHALQEKYRQAVVITKEESAQRQCFTCHDLDNSPDFEFETYWPYVEHYETEPLETQEKPGS